MKTILFLRALANQAEGYLKVSEGIYYLAHLLALSTNFKIAKKGCGKLGGRDRRGAEVHRVVVGAVWTAFGARVAVHVPGAYAVPDPRRPDRDFGHVRRVSLSSGFCFIVAVMLGWGGEESVESEKIIDLSPSSACV